VLQLDGSGIPYFWDYVSSSAGYGFNGKGSTAVNGGSWTHIAFIRNGREGSFYVNGLFNRAITSAKSVSYRNHDVYIGYDGRDKTSAFSGDMTALVVYNVALLPYQILYLYRATAATLGKVDIRLSIVVEDDVYPYPSTIVCS